MKKTKLLTYKQSQKRLLFSLLFIMLPSLVGISFLIEKVSFWFMLLCIPLALFLIGLNQYWLNRTDFNIKEE